MPLEQAIRALLDAVERGEDPRPHLQRVVEVGRGSTPALPSGSPLETWTPDTDELGASALCEAVLDGGMQLDRVLPRLRAELAAARADTRYIVGEQIGRGGTADVLSVHDRELDREVALKVLRRTDAASREAFLEEARLTARLEHPSIVPVHDVGTTADGKPFFAMKRVRGRSLRTLIEAGEQGSLRERLETLGKVCDALAFAHDAGIVHLDLKPDNVMVGEYGEVLVMDWGLGRPGSDPAPHRVAGTPAYMAPEQAEVGPVGPQADVWALGLLLLELFDGRTPFDGPPEEAIAAVRAGRIPDPARLDALPRELGSLARRCLAHRAEDRLPEAGRVGVEVRAFLADEELASVTYRPWERLAKWARRHGTAVRATVATGAVALAVLGAATGAYLARLDAAGAAAAAAALDARRQLAASMLHQGDAQLFAASPIAAAASYGRARTELVAIGDDPIRADLALADLAARHPPPVIHHGLGPLRSLEVSPDGQRAIGALGDPLGAVVIDLPAGRPRRVTFDTRIVTDVRFVDGRPLAVWVRGPDLVITDLDTEADAHVIRGAAEGARDVRLLVDQQVAASIRDPDGVHRWRIHDLRTGALLPVGGPDRPDLEGGGWGLSRDGRYLIGGAKDEGVAFDRRSPGSRFHLGFDRTVLDEVHGLHVDGTAARRVHDGSVAWPLGDMPPSLGSGLTTDHGWILLLAYDRVVRIVDEATGTPIGTIPTPLGAALMTGHSGRGVVALGEGGRVHVFTRRTDPLATRVAVQPGSELRGVTITPDGRLAIVGSGAGSVSIVDLASLRVLSHLPLNVETAPARSGLRRVRLGPDGRTLLVCARDGLLRVVDLVTGQVLHALRPGDDRVLGVAWVDARRAVSVGTSGAIVMWDVKDGREITRIQGHEGAIWDAAAAGDRLVTSGYEDRTTRVWSLPSLSPLSSRSTDGSSSHHYGVAIAPDGLAAVGTDNGTALILREPVAVLPASVGPAMAVAFSPDGRKLVTSGFSGHLNLWDAATGLLLRSYRLGAQPGLDVSFTPDGERIVQVDGYGTLHVLRIHDPHPTGVRLGPDATSLERLAALVRVGDWPAVVREVTTDPALSGEDELLATALLALERDDEAREVLIRARERGDAGAWVHIAAGALDRVAR